MGRWHWGGVALLLLTWLIGCGPTPTPPPPTATLPPPTPTVDTRLGGRLNVRISHDFDRLTPLALADDPEAGWILGLLYGGLTRLDDHLLPRPDLAESWTVSEDGLLVTFTLRPELRWSDGISLTSRDVLFTWDLLRTWDVRLGLQADLHDYVVAVTAPTSQTVAFVLNRRLAGLLSDVSFPILPEHVLRSMSAQEVAEYDLLRVPVSSGPFLLKERWPNQALVLERNPTYYGASPFLDQVAFLVAPEPGVAEMALRSGDLHLAVLPQESYLALESNPPRRALRLATYAAPQYTFVAFDLHEGSPMLDVAVRQAWALAVDKAGLVAEATSGRGIPLWSPILPYSWAYDDTLAGVRADPERAKEVLAQAGWQDSSGDGVLEKDGRPLQVRLFVRADAPERVAACRRMAEALGQVGFSIEVIPADFASVIAAKMRPPYDFDALCMQWRNLGPDPDLYYLFHSSQAWQGPEDTRPNLYNLVGYRSEEADRLILAGRGTYDPEKRRQTYLTLQRLLARDLPYYILWGEPIYIVADARLMTPEGEVNLATPAFFWNIEQWYIER